MARWVICSTGSGGPLYCPTDPKGILGYNYDWAPWTPWMEYAKKFESREDADAFLVSLVLQGYQMERDVMTLVMD